MVAANLRARALAPVVRDIWAEGFMSYNALARELNRRRVRPLRNGKQWFPMTVGRVLVRLQRAGRFTFDQALVPAHALVCVSGLADDVALPGGDLCARFCEADRFGFA